MAMYFKVDKNPFGVEVNITWGKTIGPLVASVQ
jgi:hypothetical protein